MRRIYPHPQSPTSRPPFSPLLRRLVIAILLLVPPNALLAQRITTVRVPLSATVKTDTAACSVKTVLAKAVDSLTTDSLWVRVENDRNAPASVATALSIFVSPLADTLKQDHGEKVLHLPSKDAFVGKTLTILRDGGVHVCSVSVPAPPETVEDPARHAFRVGVGASFSFLSGVSKTDLYYDVTAFLPSVWGGKDGRFGLDAGIFNARTVRTDTVPDGQSRWIVARADTDSVVAITQGRKREATISADRLGLYFAPTYRVLDHLFLVAHSEFVQSNVTTTRISNTTAADTLTRPAGDPFPGVPRYVARRIKKDAVASLADTSTSKQTLMESMFGIGGLVMLERGGIEFRTKAVLGRGDRYGESGGNYFVQFRLADSDNGFKLGGEVRGLLNGGQTTSLVYLAKDFDLKRLAEFLVGGDKK